MPNSRTLTGAITITATLVAMPLMAPTPPGPTILYVDDDAPLGGDGFTWETAYRFLQDALANAEPGNEVRVAQGIYKPDRDLANPMGTGDVGATFQLVDGVTAKGGYAGIGAVDPDDRDIVLFESVLSGDLLGDDGPNFKDVLDNSVHVVTASGTGPSTVLDGCTVTAGNAAYPTLLGQRGAGVWCEAGSPTLVACTFKSNIAAEGAGLAVIDGCPTLMQCTFEGNKADALFLIPIPGAGSGGGVYSEASSPAFLGCVFRNNMAVGGQLNSVGAGGAAYCTGTSDSIFEDCDFEMNIALGASIGALGAGGAVVSTLDSASIITNCTFTANEALTTSGVSLGAGGAVANLEGGSMTVAGCLLSRGKLEHSD
jgi:hypothetical protein